MSLSKGDAVTYVSLVAVAVLQAFDSFRKEASMSLDTHPFLASNIWAYLPIVLLSIVALIWFWRLFPWERKVSEKEIGNRLSNNDAILTHIIGKQFQSTEVVLDGYFYDDCAFQGVTFKWDGRQFLISRAHITGFNRLLTYNRTITTTIDLLIALNLLDSKFANDWKHVPVQPPR